MLRPSSNGIYIFILASGLAALSWQVLWQIKSSLALGVSAWGTAITLATTMGGMSLGALIMGHALRSKTVRPVRIYGVLECLVGLSGLCLGVAFSTVEKIDTALYATAPQYAPTVHLLGIVASVGVPTLCLGATLPVIGLIARQYKTSIALLYGLNTLGAAGGALLAAFFLIPLFGLHYTIWVVASINLIVGIAAWFLYPDKCPPEEPKKKTGPGTGLSTSAEFMITFVTGFATFTLEVAWFRSLTAAFLSTTAAFAIMLSAVLIALGVGARLVPFLKSRGASLGAILGWSGILILAVTPIVERFDLITHASSIAPHILFANWFTLTCLVIGPPILLLGVALPWLLDDQTSTRKWGLLYGFNAFAAILGSICAGWALLPTVGFARTAWLIGGLVILTGAWTTREAKQKSTILALGTLAFICAFIFESGVGRTRVQLTSDVSSPPVKILKSYEGPDATVSAVEHENGERTLVIDGFVATSQAAEDGTMFSVAYMDWMGHLPMLLHPQPKNALVIAFGTGQTANAVRKEKPASLDIVDINERVLKLAPEFVSNEGVLNDPLVNTIVMDGRAYIRRTEKLYDVITLEPMPPTFAGVNALYSQEFYQLARSKMTENGMIAQWLPIHLVPDYLSAGIARTFQSVFPNAILWTDPVSKTGILLGTVNDNINLNKDWPGFARHSLTRPLDKKAIQGAILLNREQLSRYGEFGRVITDNNQLLAYGKATYLTHGDGRSFTQDSLVFIEKAQAEKP